MKQIAVLLLAAGAVAPVLAAPDVGVSIGINQPGVYGRVNIGNVPPRANRLPAGCDVNRVQVLGAK